VALAPLHRSEIVATDEGGGEHWTIVPFLIGLCLVCGGSACSAPAGPVGVSQPAPPATSHPVPQIHSANASIRCTSCEEWNRPREPFKIFANTYYVGPAGLSSVLITTSAGHILLDGGLPQSAAVIETNIEKLGFQLADVRVIANSHAHYDHAGGIAGLQKSSGARVIASQKGAIALEAGQPTDDDPQARSGQEPEFRFPPVAHVEVVRDREAIDVGDVSLVAHYTPGHTPGSTTWTWRSCEAGRCVDLVYADSLNPVSDDGFRFTGDAARSSAVPAFQHSIEVVEHLPCDIMISVHPDFTNIDDELAARAKGAAANPFIDPGLCRSYAADARHKLLQRVAAEQTGD
jgi:metallo-beta-lactamase class B